MVKDPNFPILHLQEETKQTQVKCQTTKQGSVRRAHAGQSCLAERGAAGVVPSDKAEGTLRTRRIWLSRDGGKGLPGRAGKARQEGGSMFGGEEPVCTAMRLGMCLAKGHILL